MGMLETVGSVCSGIEAASVAWTPLGLQFQWVSEIDEFPSRVLRTHYPKMPNVGDMRKIPDLLRYGQLFAPDIICGGTPCQAFSLAGQQNGLQDDRGNLSLRFAEIVDANDARRLAEGKKPTVVFWENVEGVLSDHTNAFGHLLSALTGSDLSRQTKWYHAGYVRGAKRNVAWRVLDAKYFGIPQQRKRLYLLAGGRDYSPENILFERHEHPFAVYPEQSNTFIQAGCGFEVFRSYTDCLYAAYGTKWNGNAAAYNGSLFAVQNGRLRRLSPDEAERLMGFDAGYTNVAGAVNTTRYRAVGNSWAVPVVSWIGKRLMTGGERLFTEEHVPGTCVQMPGNIYRNTVGIAVNCSALPENCAFGSMRDIVRPVDDERLFLSPASCAGIMRRAQERHVKINPRLAYFLERQGKDCGG